MIAEKTIDVKCKFLLKGNLGIGWYIEDLPVAEIGKLNEISSYCLYSQEEGDIFALIPIFNSAAERNGVTPKVEVLASKWSWKYYLMKALLFWYNWYYKRVGAFVYMSKLNIKRIEEND